MHTWVDGVPCFVTCTRGFIHFGPHRDEQYAVEDLKARRKAQKRWQKLTDELIAKEWLDEGPDGDIFPADTEVTTEWVYDETEEDYEARIALLPDTVTIPIVSRPLNNHNTNLIREALNTES